MAAALCALATATFAGAAQAATYTYDHLPGGDINDLQTLDLTFFVHDSFTITDLNLKLMDLVHTYPGDLDIFLSHGGAAIIISSDNGSYLDLWGDYTWDDEATWFTGYLGQGYPKIRNFRPEHGLSVFDGMNAHGSWLLSIADDTGGEIGSVREWRLEFTGEPAAYVPEPATWAMMIAGFALAGAAIRRRRLVLA